MPDRIMHDESSNHGWFPILDDLEAEILGVCDGTVSVEQIIQEYHPNDTQKFDQVLFENVIQRLIRLYEYTFISW